MEHPSSRAIPAVDFGRTVVDYGHYRPGFPPELVDRLDALGVLAPTHHVVDLGTGTGSLARQLAPHVASVVGIDPSKAMLDEAREQGRGIEYRIGTAEDSGLPDEAFDLVTAGQCWHWFDRPRAAAEARRLLKPGAAIAIAHFDWIPLPGNVAAETEELILRHNPSWPNGGGTGLYPQWLTDLAEAGFADIRTFSFDTVERFTRESWIGRIRASAGVGASLDPPAVERFTSDLRRILEADELAIPHRTWAVAATKP
jgi:SAM-dependent methyltransferase